MVDALAPVYGDVRREACASPSGLDRVQRVKCVLRETKFLARAERDRAGERDRRRAGRRSDRRQVGRRFAVVPLEPVPLVGPVYAVVRLNVVPVPPVAIVYIVSLLSIANQTCCPVPMLTVPLKTIVSNPLVTATAVASAAPIRYAWPVGSELNVIDWDWPDPGPRSGS